MNDIIALNLTAAQAMGDDGTILPVTRMLDARGADTANPADAVAFVAGPDPDGQWRADIVADYGGTRQ